MDLFITIFFASSLQQFQSKLHIRNRFESIHSIIEGTVHVENQQFLIRRCPYTQTPQEVEF